MKILHSTDDWLALTKSWIYDQVRFMPDEVEQGVWCNRLVEGPHTSWNGEVFVQKHDIYSKVAGILYCRFGRFMLRPKGLINFKNYDVIFSHFGYRAWHDYLYLRGLPLKKIVRFYGCDVGLTAKQPGWMKKYKRIFDEYDLMLCEGPHMANELENIGAPREKIRWIHLGIDPDNVANELTPIEKLFNPLCILIAGTFTEKKGIEYALEGISKFACETEYPVHLTLIGDSPPSLSKELCRKKDIEHLIEKMHLLKNIQIVKKGYVPLDELNAIMKKNLIFISPSVEANNGDIEGGFPVTLTHAAANGMILIGTDHCDLPEIVHDQVNGYICEQKSSQSISDCLKRFININQASLSEKRKASLQIVSKDFNAKLLANQMCKILSEEVMA